MSTKNLAKGRLSATSSGQPVATEHDVIEYKKLSQTGIIQSQLNRKNEHMNAIMPGTRFVTSTF